MFLVIAVAILVPAGRRAIHAASAATGITPEAVAVATDERV